MLWRVVFGTMAAMLVLLAGCNQFAARAKRQEAQTALKPADYSASTKIKLNFVSATKSPQANMLAKLNYQVEGAATPAQPMTLVDPKKPEGTIVKSGGYEVHLNTFIGKPQVTSDRQRECLVQGAYTICIVSDKGEHIGEFEINPGGHLVYKGGTSDARIGVKMISTIARTLYTVHHKSVAGVPGAAFLDIEFRPAERRVEHANVASDGWNYRFDFYDGTLWLHPADHMGDDAEQLELVAAAEEKNRAAGLSYNSDTGGWVDGSSAPSFSGGCG